MMGKILKTVWQIVGIIIGVIIILGLLGSIFNMPLF